MKIIIRWEKCIRCMGCLIVCGDVFESHAMHIKINDQKFKEKCKNCKDELCRRMCPTGAIEIVD